MFAGAFWLASVIVQQQVTGAQAPTFRGAVELTLLNVLVLDQDRRPVEGLAVRDFVVLENDSERPIQAFSAVTLPPGPGNGASTWVSDGITDVATNQRGGDGRLVAILMDRSILAGPQTVTARSIARAAVDALGPGDMAAVVRNSGFRLDGKVHGFTSDKTRLRAAVDSPFTGFVVPPQMAGGGLAAALPDLAYTPDCLCGACVMDSLALVASAMGAIPERQRLILFIGSDILIADDSDPRTRGTCSATLSLARERALRALDRSNVIVYSADPTGLETLAGGFGVTNFEPRTAQANLRRQGNLAVLPSFTGGRAIVNANTPETLIASIYDETRSYYLVGFVQGGTERKQRQVRVRVSRPGVTVRTRRGSYAPLEGAAVSSSGSAPDVAARAIVGPFPERDLPLVLLLTPTFRADGSTELAVQVDMVPANAASPLASGAAVDVLVGLFDLRANLIASKRHTISVPRTGLGDAPSVARSDLAIKPGSYEVRVGVSARELGGSGSVYGYVDVGDAGSRGVALSGIVLTEGATRGAAVDITADLPTPIVRRLFARDELITATVQVKRGRDAGPATSIRARILDDRDRVRMDVSRNLGEPVFRQIPITLHSFDLPTASLGTGRYLLRIEAESSEPGSVRDVPFEVR